MSLWNQVLKSRPLLTATTVLGIVLALALPDSLRPVTRALWGWNVGVWSFLLLTSWRMHTADEHRMRRAAVLHAEGAVTVTAMAACAAVASFAAIVLELSQAKPSGGGAVAWPHVAFALSTIVASWLLLPVLFALAYASRYYGRAEGPGSGLDFPGLNEQQNGPDYADFIYFSITLAATSQTSDVQITDRRMRRWVTAQAVLSFAFNTMLLALAINIFASLI
jgi:uncharacterized membrane protein